MQIKNANGEPLMGADGVILDFEPVRFTEESAPWAVIRVDNGDVVKVRTEVSAVMRATNAVDPFGAPIYVTRTEARQIVQAAPKKDGRMVR